MVRLKEHYHLARTLKLALMVERNNNTDWKIESPCLFAKLGIILFYPLKTESEKKMFLGMRQVLNLDSTSQWLAWRENYQETHFETRQENQQDNDLSTHSVHSVESMKEQLQSMREGLLKELKPLYPKRLLLIGAGLIGDAFKGISSFLEEELELKDKITTMFHPCEIIKTPSLKKEAYRELLALNEALNLKEPRLQHNII